MHGDRMRFRNGTQEDPKYTTQTTWRLIEIQQWNSGHPKTTIQHWTPTFHANETKSSQAQRWKNVGRAIQHP